MNYQEAVEYIESVPKFTSKTDLAHTARLLEILGNPQDKIPHVVHVAGTNGKGSVCAYLNSALTASGYRCGLFTSPHLVKINERMQIGGEPVSDDAFTEAFECVMEAAGKAMEAGDAHPTYFEILFLMSLLVFVKGKADWCILETGMGGRLDQTNVIRRPDLTVITSIGMDHTEYLGDTIEAIAGEKAGIIKPGVPVIYDANCPEAVAVIRARAEEAGSPACAVTEACCRMRSQDRTGIAFTYTGASGEEDVQLRVSSIAAYQMMNAALAFEALRYLQRREEASGVTAPAKTAAGRITDASVRDGIAGAFWPCRMEQIREGIILDGAHNEDGIGAFVKTAQYFHQTGPVTILFSAVSDKDYPEMIRRIALEVRPEHVVTTGVQGSRHLAASVFAEHFRACGCEDVIARESAAEALQAARELRGDGMLFCVGSLYLAGELRAILRES